MSKEVEAAIKRIRNTIVYLGRKSGKTRYFEDINLIIEQAERVQELEETVEDYKTVNKELHLRGRKVRKQNKRYRELLETVIENGQCSTIDNIAKELYK